MGNSSIFACIAALSILVSSATLAGGISVFPRSGQTFITWHEKADTTERYNLYQSDKPLTSASLKTARLIAGNIPSGTGIDLFAEQAKTLVKIQSVKDPMGPDWFHQVEPADPANVNLPHTRLVIDELGKPLPDGTALYVHNINKSGKSYYAVTSVDKSGHEDISIVPGVNSTLAPVDEKPGHPAPVLVHREKRQSGDIVETYLHWSTNETSARESIPFKFQISIGPAVKDRTRAPLMLLIHSAGGPETLPVSIGDNFIVIAPNNSTSGFPHIYDWWYGYNSRIFDGNLKDGVNVNYTENRLLYLLDWCKSKFRIDKNRIYLGGVSMGGTGSVSFGLRHPEIFAAVYANVPDTNTGNGTSIFESWFEGMWGKRSDAVKTNEGISVWDRLNMTQYVRSHMEDLPFIKTISARDDVAMPWQQIPEFLRALNDTRHGFISGWGKGGHNLPFEDRPMTVRRFDIYKLAKNISYPAFSNSSINDDPGNGGPDNGTTTGQMGGGFDWRILKDQSGIWSAEIKICADGLTGAVTDITPRRLQKFKPEFGEEYEYTNTAKDGVILQSGKVTADKWNLITLPEIKISSAGNIITIRK